MSPTRTFGRLETRLRFVQCKSLLSNLVAIRHTWRHPFSIWRQKYFKNWIYMEKKYHLLSCFINIWLIWRREVFLLDSSDLSDKLCFESLLIFPSLIEVIGTGALTFSFTFCTCVSNQIRKYPNQDRIKIQNFICCLKSSSIWLLWCLVIFAKFRIFAYVVFCIENNKISIFWVDLDCP